MAPKLLIAVLMTAAVSPVPAAQPDLPPAMGAPEAGPGAKYCLRVDPLTGSNIETVKCWTREKWADQGVDVDKVWAEEGVRVIA